MKRYMVIERFKPGCWDAVYQRFEEHGRQLPDGLHYLNSWASKRHMVCYQLMETQFPELFDHWFKHWEDLIDFELIEIDERSGT